MFRIGGKYRYNSAENEISARDKGAPPPFRDEKSRYPAPAEREPTAPQLHPDRRAARSGCPEHAGAHL